jgi:hypothetical protein
MKVAVQPAEVSAWIACVIYGKLMAQWPEID